MSDYRCTEYDSSLDDIQKDKDLFMKGLRKKHPRAVDLYPYISPNIEDTFKPAFMKVYKEKCCYCGVSISNIPVELFEIDHFRNKKHPKFASVAEAGTIENLVLACRQCNRLKSDFPIDDDDYKNFFPDDGSIKNSFVRTDDYYIRISPEKAGDSKIQQFFEQLQLGSETQRLDFLLMSMYGLKEKIESGSEAWCILQNMIDELQKKRNGFKFVVE